MGKKDKTKTNKSAESTAEVPETIADPPTDKKKGKTTSVHKFNHRRF
jgi:hypothetical protein